MDRGPLRVRLELALDRRTRAHRLDGSHACGKHAEPGRAERRAGFRSGSEIDGQSGHVGDLVANWRVV